MTEEEFDEYMSWLIDIGAAKIHDYAENGQPMYKFDLDLLQTVAPEMYSVFLQELDEELMDLYQAGLVDIEYDENLTARFSISEKGKIFAETGIMPEDDVE
jgi:hypothetical protein